MLMLEREVGEWIDVLLPDGRKIGICLSEIKQFQGKAVLGFHADRDIQIVRRDAKVRGPRPVQR